MWRVLVVEDNPEESEAVLKALKKTAHCQTAPDGQKAIEAFQKHLAKTSAFDFILMDVTMPQKDGFETLKAIRRIEERSLPAGKSPARIIMVTAYKDSLMEFYNMGWDDFMTKPVDPKILLERMRSMLHPAE